MRNKCRQVCPQKCAASCVLMKSVSCQSDAVDLLIECCDNGFKAFCYQNDIDPADLTKICANKVKCKYKTGQNRRHLCIWVNTSGPIYCGLMKNHTRDDFRLGTDNDEARLVSRVGWYFYIQSLYSSSNIVLPSMITGDIITHVSKIKPNSTRKQAYQSQLLEFLYSHQ